MSIFDRYVSSYGVKSVVKKVEPKLTRSEEDFFRKWESTSAFDLENLRRRESAEDDRIALMLAMAVKKGQSLDRALEFLYEASDPRNLEVSFDAFYGYGFIGCPRDTQGLIRKVTEYSAYDLIKLNDRLLQTYEVDYPITVKNYTSLLEDPRITLTMTQEDFKAYSVGKKIVPIKHERGCMEYSGLSKLVDAVNEFGNGPTFKFYPFAKWVDVLAKIIMRTYTITLVPNGLRIVPQDVIGIKSYDYERIMSHTVAIRKEFDGLIGDGILKIRAVDCCDKYSAVYASLYDSGIAKNMDLCRKVSELMTTVGRGWLDMDVEYRRSLIQPNMDRSPCEVGSIMDVIGSSVSKTIDRIIQLSKDRFMGVMKSVKKDAEENIRVSPPAASIISYLQETEIDEIDVLEIIAGTNYGVIRELEYWMKYHSSLDLKDWYDRTPKFASLDGVIGEFTGNWNTFANREDYEIFFRIKKRKALRIWCCYKLSTGNYGLESNGQLLESIGESIDDLVFISEIKRSELSELKEFGDLMKPCKIGAVIRQFDHSYYLVVARKYSVFDDIGVDGMILFHREMADITSVIKDNLEGDRGWRKSYLDDKFGGVGFDLPEWRTAVPLKLERYDVSGFDAQVNGRWGVAHSLQSLISVVEGRNSKKKKKKKKKKMTKDSLTKEDVD